VQYGAKHICGAVLRCFEDCVAGVVVYYGERVDFFGGNYMCDVVVYHGFEAILGFLEEAWWGCRADHWSEEGAEDEYFKQDVAEMEAV
jgi:hypothetical protein